jgi:hypothetical protein
MSQVYWCMFVIPALGRIRKKDHEFEASLDYIVRHYLKIKSQEMNTK